MFILDKALKEKIDKYGSLSKVIKSKKLCNMRNFKLFECKLHDDMGYIFHNSVLSRMLLGTYQVLNKYMLIKLTKEHEWRSGKYNLAYKNHLQRF